jgi:hypothetical protein
MNTEELTRLRRRHLQIGWASLFVFVVLGGGLELLHGFKVDWYLAVGNETRRLLWRLAHAHGTFLSLVHIAFAASLTAVGDEPPRLASPCLLGASIAVPAGFLLAGIGADAGDPGAGILLVPLGLVLLLTAIGSCLRSLRSR